MDTFWALYPLSKSFALGLKRAMSKFNLTKSDCNTAKPQTSLSVWWLLHGYGRSMSQSKLPDWTRSCNSCSGSRSKSWRRKSSDGTLSFSFFAENQNGYSMIQLFFQTSCKQLGMSMAHHGTSCSAVLHWLSSCQAALLTCHGGASWWRTDVPVLSDSSSK